ncbi:MAG: hypothetical protein WAL30_06565 [Candidatus Aquirickettsiella sp.]
MSSKNKLIYCIEFLWLLSILILATVIYLHQDLIGLFFNSDHVMFPSFFSDIFFNHGHYQDWVISPAPHFFPDMLLFPPFFFIIKNIYFQFLIAIWLMIIITYIALKLIYSQFFSIKTSTVFTLAALGSLFILALKNVSPYMLALLPAVHIGEFLMGLFLIGIQLKILDTTKLSIKKYILGGISALITFCCSLSDLLFVEQFAPPIFLAYSFLYFKKYIKFNQWLLFSSLVIFPGILGALLTKHLVPKDILFDYLSHPSLIKVSFSSLSLQLVLLIKIIKNISNFFIICVFIIFYLSVFLFFYFIKLESTKNNIKFNDNIKIIFLNIFILCSVLISMISMCFLSNQGYVLDRYIIPFFFFPFLLFFPTQIYIFKSYQFITKIYIFIAYLIFIYILASLYNLFHKSDFKVNMNYYPPDIRCIDEVLRGHGHNGIAQYWDANYLTSLSKENLEIVPVNPDLTPMYWSINVRKFENPISFIVLDKGNLFSLNKDIIYTKYGIPKKEVTCYTRKVLIYPKDSIKLSSKFVSD